MFKALRYWREVFSYQARRIKYIVLRWALQPYYLEIEREALKLYKKSESYSIRAETFGKAYALASFESTRSYFQYLVERDTKLCMRLFVRSCLKNSSRNIH